MRYSKIALLPTVSCQGVTVPVRDNVAIIFASTLSPPSYLTNVTLWLKGAASPGERFKV